MKEVQFLNPMIDTQRYSLDQHGSGNLFADTFADRLRYVTDTKSWFGYDGATWQEDDSEIIAEQLASSLLTFLKDLGDPNLDELIEALSKYSGRKTMIKEARRVNPVRLTEFDNSPYLLNCHNCTLDLSGTKIKQLSHSPDHLLTKTTNVIYDPKAHCERWLKFVDEIMIGDKGLIRYFQKALGYALIGDTSKECFFLLYGATTRNGKGTTTETILHLLGDYGKTLPPNRLAMGSYDSVSTSSEFARLVGTHYVNISEPKKGLKLNVALLKQLTGGDKITVQHKFKKPFEIRPYFKIFINTNHYLEIDDDTIFTSDRVKMIPFLKHFDEIERDESLKQQFKEQENMSGILNWLLDGYLLLKKEGLEPPDKAVEALNNYRKECDTIALFMEHSLNKAAKSKIKTSELYVKYLEWCVEADIDKVSQKEFVAKLKEKQLVSRDGTDGNVVRGYKIKSPEKSP